MSTWILELRVYVSENTVAEEGAPRDWDINDWVDHVHAYRGRADIIVAIPDPNEEGA